MLVATRSFSTEYDGESIEIRAGRTHVAEGHALAQDGRGAWRPPADGARASEPRVKPAGAGTRVGLRAPMYPL